MDRREFLGVLASASAAGMFSGCGANPLRQGTYDASPFGNARILHITDSHAQLLPVYFREPNVNIGIGAANGRYPHRVGKALLDGLGHPLTPREMHAFTYLDFSGAAARFGKVGGFAHLKTLVDMQ